MKKTYLEPEIESESIADEDIVMGSDVEWQDDWGNEWDPYGD